MSLTIEEQLENLQKGEFNKGLHAQIRDFICEYYIKPARNKGVDQITLIAGNVHSRMNLHSRMPAVCSVLKSNLLEEQGNVEIISTRGPPSGQSSTVSVSYNIK